MAPRWDPGEVVVGIRCLSSYLPPKIVSLDDLQRSGKIETPKEHLRAFGFQKVRVAERSSAFDLAEKAAQRLLRQSRTRPEEIDVLLYATALPELAPPAARRRRSPAALFRYPATLLQYRLGMDRANVVAIAQAGCVSFLGATRLARDMIAAESSIHRVLCVSGDVLPAAEKREILYNLISDGACAALVERDSPVNRIVAYSQVTRGFYWDSEGMQNEIVASYFATARMVIQSALEKAGLRLSDIKLIIPHNVNRKSWEVLLKLVGAPESKFFGRNIARKGHTIAADNIINLQDALRGGLVKRGDYLLLFTFGFGAHWACLILQH